MSKLKSLAELGEKLAEAAFTAGDGTKASRLLFSLHNGENYGGWAEGPLGRQLTKVLESYSTTALVENKVELQFMVVPELLATMAYVPDPVRVKIIDPDAIFLTGILGESGRKLVNAGIEFYFARPLAEKLISKGIAVESSN